MGTPTLLSQDPTTIPDLNVLTQTPIGTPLPADILSKILTQPPFLSLPSALNLRTISHPPNLQPNLMFRSGTLSHLPSSSILTLKNTYNTTTIFDLRTQAERLRYPAPSIEGVEIFWIPSVNDAGGAPKREILKQFKEEGAVKVVVPMYRKMLETHREVFKGVFGWLREGGLGGGGLLFHCTAGKDRTGVLAALILELAGASREFIAHDYALTRIGMEQAREKLVTLLQKDMGCGFEEPGMEEMVGVKGETMVRFLEWIEERWGGVEGYLRSELGFENDDVRIIKENLRVSQKESWEKMK